MTRFSSVVLVVILAGCAGPAPIVAPLIPLSAAPPSAFAVEPGALAAVPEAWRQNIDPLELLGESLDFPAVRLLPSGDPPPPEGDGAQMVVRILREFVAPGKWNPDALTVQDGTLATRQAPGVLAALQSALQTLKDNRGRMIRTQFRGHVLPADALSRVENIPPVGGGLVGTFERKALKEVLRNSDPNGVVGAAMQITTFHGQQSSFMLVDQKGYVSGFDPAEGSYDPQVALASEGIAAELRSIANGSRPDEFLLSFEVQLAGPTEVVNVPLGSGIVQMPAQGYARLSGRCSLRSDQALLLVTRNLDTRAVDRPLLAITIMIDWKE